MKSEYRRPDPVIYAERVLDGLPYQDLESNIWIFLEEVTGKKKFDLINLFQNENFCLSQQEFNLFKKMLERRKNHEPVAYIIGKKNFYGYDFKTGPGVLIPRFETELLVERVGKICDNKKILDLCSGSGCIGITLVKEFHPESVCCTDISETALNFTKLNAESILNSNEQRKVTIVKSDMFENLKEKFDIIVSNPPYIEKKDVLTLESTVKDFEPVNALDGGEDGLDFYRIIQKKLPEFLNKNGNLFLEIGYNQGESVFNLFKESFEKAQIIKDYSNFNRIFAGINFKNI